MMNTNSFGNQGFISNINSSASQNTAMRPQANSNSVSSGVFGSFGSGNAAMNHPSSSIGNNSITPPSGVINASSMRFSTQPLSTSSNNAMLGAQNTSNNYSSGSVLSFNNNPNNMQTGYSGVNMNNAVGNNVNTPINNSMSYGNSQLNQSFNANTSMVGNSNVITGSPQNNTSFGNQGSSNLGSSNMLMGNQQTSNQLLGAQQASNPLYSNQQNSGLGGMQNTGSLYGNSTNQFNSDLQRSMGQNNQFLTSGVTSTSPGSLLQNQSNIGVNNSNMINQNSQPGMFQNSFNAGVMSSPQVGSSMNTQIGNQYSMQQGSLNAPYNTGSNTSSFGNTSTLGQSQVQCNPNLSQMNAQQTGNFNNSQQPGNIYNQSQPGNNINQFPNISTNSYYNTQPGGSNYMQNTGNMASNYSNSINFQTQPLNNSSGLMNNQNTSAGLLSNNQNCSNPGYMNSIYGNQQNNMQQANNYGGNLGTQNSMYQSMGSVGPLYSNNMGGQMNQGCRTTKRFVLGTKQPKEMVLGSVQNPGNDMVVPSCPGDTVTDIKFSPKASILAVSAWDGSISLYDVQSNSVFLKARRTFSNFIYKTCWDSEGKKLFMGSSKGAVQMWDLESDSIVDMYQHTRLVSAMSWVENSTMSCLMSGSWDQYVFFWDIRSGINLFKFKTKTKIISGEFLNPYAAVITQDRHAHIYQVTGKRVMHYREVDTSSKLQMKCFSLNGDKLKGPAVGYLAGSIAGRVFGAKFNYTGGSDSKPWSTKLMTTKAQYTSKTLYAVNSIAATPCYTHFATGSSDGYVTFWERSSRKKFSIIGQMTCPVTNVAFDSTGEYFAYATGYDWSRGYEYYDRYNMKPQVFIRNLKQKPIKEESCD